MIVSWNWLSQYVRLDMPESVLSERLALTGLNHESTEEVGGDLAIDLEVTSNRPDCLGHLGVAREVSVLFGKDLNIPDPRPKTSGAAVDSLTSVAVEDADLCPQVHRPRRLGRDHQGEPLVDAEEAGDARRAADLERRGRDELRHVRVRPAAACL